MRGDSLNNGLEDAAPFFDEDGSPGSFNRRFNRLYGAVVSINTKLDDLIKRFDHREEQIGKLLDRMTQMETTHQNCPAKALAEDSRVRGRWSWVQLAMLAITFFLALAAWIPFISRWLSK